MAYQPLRKKPKVCIVGTSNSRDLTPFGDPDYEFWGVNNLYGVPLKGAHWDRWFEIHDIWFDENRKLWLRRGDPEFRGQSVESYLKDLAKLPCPVYMQRLNPLVPNAILYPLDEVVAQYGDYLTNTITIEIVLALLEGFESIAIYGVNMAAGTEYMNQRPSCEWALGIAMALGVKVVVPDESDLLKSKFIYGFHERRQHAWQKKLKGLKADFIKRRKESADLAERHRRAADHYMAAEKTLQEVEKMWVNLDDEVQHAT
jgi:hypothetical protein